MQYCKEVEEPYEDLVVVKFFPSVESFLEIIIKLFGVCVVYILFKFVGDQLLGDQFRPDTLLSLVVLPAIYILKDSYLMFEPYFVRVSLSDKTVTVESGILTKRLDCLNLKTVENVEMIRTVLGRLLGYGTLNVYAYGSWVEIPYVENVSIIKSKIESSIE